MSNSIYLFKQHENFQVGKSYLNRASVFQTNYFWLIFWIIVALAIIWGGGEFFRGMWGESQTIGQTNGIVSACNLYASSINENRRVSIASYEYQVQNQNYSSQENLSRLRPRQDCEDVSIGMELIVYYRLDSPERSMLEPYIHAVDWLLPILPIAIGIFIILVCYIFLQENRYEHYKYAQLRRSGILLEASVTNIGLVPAGTNGKKYYTYADYKFLNPNGVYLQGKIDNARQYQWPIQIQVGDTLHVLYLNDEVFCLL